MINVTHKEDQKEWIKEQGWGWGNKPFSYNFREMNQHNETNSKSSCSTTILQKQFRILSRCKRNKAFKWGEEKADKVSGYNTRDVSLPYDLMWVSAGLCSLRETLFFNCAMEQKQEVFNLVTVTAAPSPSSFPHLQTLLLGLNIQCNYISALRAPVANPRIKRYGFQ